MLGLESFLRLLKRNSVEKINGGVYATWYGDTIIAIIVGILLHDFLAFMFARRIPIVYLIGIIVVFLGVIFYISTRRAMFGVTDNNFVYVKLKRITTKEKEVNEVPIDKIKYLDVKKILGINFVKLYFINDVGKFTKRKFMFASYVLGFNYNEYKKNYEIVREKLVSTQKILDKGDF